MSVELEEKWRDQIPTVEQIQDVVEDVLIRFDYAEMARPTSSIGRSGARPAKIVT